MCFPGSGAMKGEMGLAEGQTISNDSRIVELLELFADNPDECTGRTGKADVRVCGNAGKADRKCYEFGGCVTSYLFFCMRKFDLENNL